MSPRDFLAPRAKRLLLTGAALVSAIVVITGPIAGAAGKVDQRYVKQAAFDSLRIVQQGEHALDSAHHDHELRQINEKLSRVDSGINCLRTRSDRWCR